MRSGVPQGSVINLLLFLLFGTDLPDVLEADDVKMITEHEPSQFSYCRIRLVEEMVPTDQSC